MHIFVNGYVPLHRKYDKENHANVFTKENTSGNQWMTL
jgi:hypothetical protein